MNIAGRMKLTPATTRPAHRRRRQPMWIAISVEFGPGIRFVAPRRSRNCSSRQPRAPSDDLVPHHGDVRGGPPESGRAQSQEKRRQLAERGPGVRRAAFYSGRIQWEAAAPASTIGLRSEGRLIENVVPASGALSTSMMPPN